MYIRQNIFFKKALRVRTGFSEALYIVLTQLPLTSLTELRLSSVAAKLAQYRVLLKTTPKFMSLKIKFNSPKAYELGLTFTWLNCEKGN